jgi:hypothetical protein
MWSQLSARSLVSLQQLAAIREIDRRIAEAWRDGYGPEADALLERRFALKWCLETGQVPGASESQ